MNLVDTDDASLSLADAFKGAMRRLATTVTIVTATAADGPVGMTATAVTSVCAEPPAVLACVNRSASIHPTLAMGARFCINILSAHHGDLSWKFGGKAEPAERFIHGDWLKRSDGIPYLADAQSNIFCIVDRLLDYGTHTIVIGRVETIILSNEIRPLIYGNGKFLTIS